MSSHSASNALSGHLQERKMKAKLSLTIVVLLTLLLAAFGCTQFGSRSDAQVATDVQSKINADASLPNKQITIQAANGVVTLSGTLGSDMERTTAANDAAQIRGVKTVVNNLQVGTTAAQISAPAAEQQQAAPAAAPAPEPARQQRTQATTSRPRLAHRTPAAAPAPTRDYGDNSASTASSSTASSAPATASNGSNSGFGSTSSAAMPTLAAPAAPVAPAKVTVTEGTQLSIRLVDEINTERSH